MSTTIEQMNDLVAVIAQLRSQEEEASRVKKEINERLELEEAKMVEILAAERMTTFNSPFGKVVLAYRTSVKTPKTPEAKAAFYQWLKDKELFDTMISVNSNSLNSLYKTELEEARIRGDADFTIPGLDECTITPQLRFSKS